LPGRTPGAGSEAEGRYSNDTAVRVILLSRLHTEPHGGEPTFRRHDEDSSRDTLPGRGRDRRGGLHHAVRANPAPPFETVIVFDEDLHVARVGIIYDLLGRAMEWVRFRSRSPRMPEALRFRWIEAVRYEDPQLSRGTVCGPDEPGCLTAPLLAPVDWLGDDINLSEHYFRLDEIDFLEVLPVSTAHSE
jgi:hypothetical protein